jgi:hypothetical protein
MVTKLAFVSAVTTAKQQRTEVVHVREARMLMSLLISLALVSALALRLAKFLRPLPIRAVHTRPLPRRSA